MTLVTENLCYDFNSMSYLSWSLHVKHGLIAVESKLRYHKNMILSFYDNEAKAIWNGVFSKRLLPQIQEIATRKLRMINAAQSLDDLRIPPFNQLEKLYRNREGQWSIRINKQWCICFIWENGNASRVEICDYH